MIAEHAAMRGAATAGWIQPRRQGQDDTNTTISRMKISIFTRRTRRTPWIPLPVGPILHLLRQSDVDAADESWFERGRRDICVSALAAGWRRKMRQRS